ncbi:DUF5801 repeats-in-toxin domain-containing protein, partial [Sphingomonas sp. ASV193]|uniref:beta strand repeat-containing protein n=1 Tax=Sphingomonas sp. ASV193 TaxID=3144405 RepID=UPI0032E8D05A
ETVTGQLSVGSATGYTPISTTTAHGIFVLNADGSYTYTLTSPFSDSTGTNNGTTSDGTETFTYTAHDANGNTVTGTITINVLDDVPHAVADSGTVTEGGLLTVAASGVLGNDVAGADGYASGGGVVGATTGSNTAVNTQNVVGGSVTVVGSYGTLTLYADGHYTYQADANAISTNQVDHFVYTIKDGDGDLSTTTLDINVNAVTLTADNQTKTVNEAALDTTTTGSDLGHGTVTGSNPSLTTETVTGQLSVGSATGYTPISTTTAHGIFVLNADGSYTYTLTSPVTESPSANNGTDTVNGVEVFTYTAHDANGNTITGTITINVTDDVPFAAISVTNGAISLDESVGLQADSNDVAGPIAAFTGVTNVGLDPDTGNAVVGYAQKVGAISASGSAYGADGAGTTVFSLSTVNGTDSGVQTTDGAHIFLYNEMVNGQNVIVGRVGSQAGAAAFAVAVDPSNGTLSMVEYLSIHNPDATNPDDSVSIVQGAITSTVTVTDHDGDISTVSAQIGNLISFQDSAPILTAVDNINIQNSGDLAATGHFAYNLGADGASADNNVFTAVTGSATVNGNPVQNYTISETSESATSAVYSFSFDYATGVGGTAHETGTLTFDKVAGTYTVDLDNPISGYSVLATAGAPASAFVNYNANGSTSQGPSNIATVQLANNFYIQFTGDSSGSHTTVSPDGTFVPVTTNSFGGLELFTGSAATVTVSSSAAGVAGNTIQGGEVLDFNLYSSNPQASTGGVPTASATSMFIELDGVGTSEDMIVVLKLYDTVTHQYTTEALMVQNGDIIKSNATLAGTAYSGITLDNNDGLIVIEANDYQQGNSNLVIVGAQIAGSDDGITGTAINFNGALGASGGSSGTQSFQTDVSDQPFKIQNIGFLTTTTTNQNADLTFNATIKDGDGDTVSQIFHATITGSADSQTPLTLAAAVTTVTPVVLDTNHDGAINYLATSAGVHYDMNGDGHADQTAWVASGDSILFRDDNGDHTVTNASEFTFGHDGVSDLQALRAQYGDTLDANDADFAKFGVWNDANGNGRVDAGEVMTLAQAGITSISLVSNGVASSAAGGDVQVGGSASYIYTAGGVSQTGLVNDVALSYAAASASAQAQVVSRMAMQGSNGVMTAALAAAGLALAGNAWAGASPHLLRGGDAEYHGLVVAKAAASLAAAHDEAQPVRSMLANEHATPVESHASSEAHSLAAAPAHEPVVPTFAHAAAMTALAQGTTMPAIDHPQAMVALPAMPVFAAAALQPVAKDAVAGPKHAEVVGKILADAIEHDSPTAKLLAQVTGDEQGANGVKQLMAIQSGHAVPGWDGGHGAHFAPAILQAITMESMAIHHDAVQPTVHG